MSKLLLSIAALAIASAGLMISSGESNAAPAAGLPTSSPTMMPTPTGTPTGTPTPAPAPSPGQPTPTMAPQP